MNEKKSFYHSPSQPTLVKSLEGTFSLLPPSLLGELMSSNELYPNVKWIFTEEWIYYIPRSRCVLANALSLYQFKNRECGKSKKNMPWWMLFLKIAFSVNINKLYLMEMNHRLNTRHVYTLNLKIVITD